MSELLKGLLGRRVAVFTLDASGTKDEGVVEAVDDKFPLLNKGEELLPYTSIRIIKAQ